MTDETADWCTHPEILLIYKRKAETNDEFYKVWRCRKCSHISYTEPKLIVLEEEG